VCGKHVGYRRLYNSRRKWQCSSCQTWLEIDYPSIILVGFCCAIWGTFIVMKLHDPLWSVLLFTLGALVFSQVLSVCVVEKAQPPTNRQHPHDTPKT